MFSGEISVVPLFTGALRCEILIRDWCKILYLFASHPFASMVLLKKNVILSITNPPFPKEKKGVGTKLEDRKEGNSLCMVTTMRHDDISDRSILSPSLSASSCSWLRFPTVFCSAFRRTCVEMLMRRPSHLWFPQAPLGCINDFYPNSVSLSLSSWVNRFGDQWTVVTVNVVNFESTARQLFVVVKLSRTKKISSDTDGSGNYL